MPTKISDLMDKLDSTDGLQKLGTGIYLFIGGYYLILGVKRLIEDEIGVKPSDGLF